MSYFKLKINDPDLVLAIGMDVFKEGDEFVSDTDNPGLQIYLSEGKIEAIAPAEAPPVPTPSLSLSDRVAALEAKLSELLEQLLDEQLSVKALTPISELSAEDAIAMVKSSADAEQLQFYRQLESSNDNRKTVLKAIATRLEELGV